MLQEGTTLLTHKYFMIEVEIYVKVVHCTIIDVVIVAKFDVD